MHECFKLGIFWFIPIQNFKLFHHLTYIFADMIEKILNLNEHQPIFHIPSKTDFLYVFT